MTRTLVAEDDADIRELIFLLLQRAGHHVTTVGDGVEALDALQHSDYDLVVTDHHMPGTTGAELVEQVIATTLSTRVLLMSADHRVASVVARTDTRARFLGKPFDPRALLDVVESLTADETTDPSTSTYEPT